MRLKIKLYFEGLSPKKLGLEKRIKVSSVSKLGMGASNLNYLVKLNGGNFIFRMNMEPDKKNKSRKEFDALKSLEPYDISPKAWVMDESKKYFDSEFIIISYIPGKTLNNISEYYKPKMFRKLGKLCGELHGIKINGRLKKLKKEFLCGYKEQVSSLKKLYINDLGKKLDGKKLMKIIDESFSNLHSKTPFKKYVPDIVLDQGDFHEENIVVSGGEYRLIDFEDLKITDRATSLANIFSDFGKPFKEGQKKLFLDEYFKNINVDKEDLIERINIRIPIETFSVFLWSVWHLLRARDKELHSAFLEGNDIKEDYKYVNTMFKRCLKFGIIDGKYKDFDIVGALG